MIFHFSDSYVVSHEPRCSNCSNLYRAPIRSNLELAFSSNLYRKSYSLIRGVTLVLELVVLQSFSSVNFMVAKLRMHAMIPHVTLNQHKKKDY